MEITLWEDLAILDVSPVLVAKIFP